MLELNNIHKNYNLGVGQQVKALKKISLNFRQNEFVSILGPSGCGKTTLLNLIGGLDKYTKGDLKVWGKSTKDFSDRDWDAYRNKSIGFVFQNYNLIQHISVLENVEIALTISGISKDERKKKSVKVLQKVGLSDQINKKPNQLSGGQMQRVAMARALVNDPEILLADEPTGALDSETSHQILELLQEISKNRLVIMVTHNQKLADKYSTRIINLLDGVVQDDSNPYTEADDYIQNTSAWKKTKSMSFLTALSLSFNNLKTKKTRTIITSFAGSIGIIGIALILAVSNGFQQYIDKFQADTLSGFPLEIRRSARNDDFMSMLERKEEDVFDDDEYIYVRKVAEEWESDRIINDLSQDYIENAIETIPEDLYHSIHLSKNFNFKIYSRNQDPNNENQHIFEEVRRSVRRGGTVWREMLDNEDFLLSQYDVVHGEFPQAQNDIVIVLDKQNRISDVVLKELGLYNLDDPVDQISFGDIIGETYRILDNDLVYNKVNDIFVEDEINNTKYSQGIEIGISGILRPKPETTTGSISSAIAYHPDLLDEIFSRQQESQIVEWMEEKKENEDWRSPFTNELFEETKDTFLQTVTPEERFENLFISLGGREEVNYIDIYPIDFEAKEQIKAHLDEYNESVDSENRVYYTDIMEDILGSFRTVLSGVSYILIAFTSISLFVASILIGIITYISVIERTREIGILRSIGARKKDITHVFNAETFIVGFLAGVIGVLFAFILSFPINALLRNLIIEIGNVAVFSIAHILILIFISLMLTSIAGFIPSRIAARKDPVEALRDE